jgi:hypothetical protein
MRPVREGRIAGGAGAEWLLGKVLELTAVGRKVQGAKERTWAWPSSQAKVVLCRRARHRTTRFLVSIRQCTKAMPYSHHQRAI